MNIRDRRVRPITTVLTVLALVVGMAGPAGAAPPTPARPDLPGAPGAPGAPPECEEDGSGTHPEVGCGDEGDDDGGTGDDDGGTGDNEGGGIDPGEACAGYPGWGDCEGFVAMNGIHPDHMCGYMIDPNQDLLDYYHPEAPEGALLRTWVCPPDGLYYTEDTDWVLGGAAPLPDPEDVADDIWAEVQAELLHPALETWPPQNMSSVLRLPTFVAVNNWQGEQHREDCDDSGLICVELTATPALSFDPGDGEDVVPCEAGGTRFDRLGDEPEVQAAGDACAHVYTRRTGVDDRPDAWPGVVSVTWTVEWQEVGGAGESGDIGPLVLSTDLPRVVTELFSVVTEVTPTGRG